jgi:L-histidine Nalpha-methyltransferase
MNRYQRCDLPRGEADDFGAALISGLTGTPKNLPCRYLYDELGSRLFEAICALDDYYPTRCEREILIAHAGELARSFAGHGVVELGSGNSEKTVVLLEAFGGAVHYVPVDIDPEVLDRAGQRLLGVLPDLRVTALAGEYGAGMARAAEVIAGPKLVVLLGGNVGNFTRAGATDFLAGLGGRLGPEDALLLGADLRKEAAVLELAYDDPTGVTAAFSLNLLGRANRELGGNFDQRAFRHVAHYEEREGVVGLFLESLEQQRVSVAGRRFDFAAGERIHIEDSTKYSLAELTALAEQAGFELAEHWLDGSRRYSLNLLRPTGRD